MTMGKAIALADMGCLGIYNDSCVYSDPAPKLVNHILHLALRRNLSSSLVDKLTKGTVI